MANWVQKIQNNPKITATVIFMISLTIIMYLVGYFLHTKNHGLEGAVKAGFIWVGATYGIMILLAFLTMFVFETDFWTFFLLGGDGIAIIFQLIGALLHVMAQ